jgi:dihydrofolate reductase
MKLTVNTFLTLDGVMQAPGGAEEDASGGFTRGGWIVPHFDEKMGGFVDGWFASADEILLGRHTFTDMRTYWSKVDQSDNAVSAALNTLPKHLVSATVTDPDWGNTSVIAADVVAAVRDLKERPGRELQVHGSWQLARTLHDAGLVDEYRLLVCPVVVGSGKRLFAEGAAPATFTLVSSETTSSGVTHQVLRPRAFETGTFEVRDGKEAAAGQ